jgi:transcription initiation factor TFIIIB Brf1 subunit/transcription initiation factor TFIIB
LSLKKVSQRRVQLIAITCLFVASKYEEIYYPTLKDFEWLSNGTISGRDIVKAESIVLAALGFDLASVNPFHFIRRFSKAAHSSRRTHELTKYVMELSLGVYSMLGHKPSVVAAACVYIARAMTHQSPLWVRVYRVCRVCVVCAAAKCVACADPHAGALYSVRHAQRRGQRRLHVR